MIAWGDTSEPDAVVIGVGNVLMGDDALGPYVVRSLAATFVIPEAVRCLDGATGGFALAQEVVDCRALVIVDAIRAAGPPGTLIEERRSGAPPAPGVCLGPHEPRLDAALLLAALEGRAPGSVWLVGAVPARVAPGCGLSHPVRRAVPQLIQRVVAILASCGYLLEPLPTASRPDIWWERAVR